MDGGDELYSVKNLFWLGNYADAISEARSLRLKEGPARAERDIIVLRALCGQGNYAAVTSEVRDDAGAGARAVRALATFMAGGAGRAGARAAVEALLADGATAGDATVQTVGALVALASGDAQGALRALRSPQGIEHLALTAQLHLRIDRPDLAERTVKAMQAMDDEAALTTLSAAQLCLALGGDRIKEAGAYFRELNDRFGGSVAGVNGLAAVYIAQGKHADAERLLEELLESAPGQPDALLNLVAIAEHGGRAEAAAKRLEELRAVAPEHPYLAQAALVDATFDRVAATYKV